MTLRIADVDEDTIELWRAIHNQIIPTAPLSREDVIERLSRNHLTLAYDGAVPIGNATLRPPTSESSTSTVIVRVLPEFRRRGFGSAYLTSVLGTARSLGADRIQTVVLASNEDGLAFALANGFVEHDRYSIEGDEIPFIDLHLVD